MSQAVKPDYALSRTRSGRHATASTALDVRRMPCLDITPCILRSHFDIFLDVRFRLFCRRLARNTRCQTMSHLTADGRYLAHVSRESRDVAPRRTLPRPSVPLPALHAPIPLSPGGERTRVRAALGGRPSHSARPRPWRFLEGAKRPVPEARNPFSVLQQMVSIRSDWCIISHVSHISAKTASASTLSMLPHDRSHDAICVLKSMALLQASRMARAVPVQRPC